VIDDNAAPLLGLKDSTVVGIPGDEAPSPESILVVVNAGEWKDRYIFRVY